ncbi:MAG: hypothetical protein ACREQF_11320 [Candidatus Binataceae bacterium]
MPQPRYLAYRALCVILMLAAFLVGLTMLFGFLTGTLAPYSMTGGQSSLPPTDYWGYYWMGYGGCLLITWGAMLAPALRAPALSRGIGTATALGLVINAVFRMAAWFSGEYAETGNVLRVEAAGMLLLAIALVWLRPPRAAATAENSLVRG